MARYGDEIPKWGKRRKRENEREIEACCFWPQKVVERGRRGDRGKRAVHTDGAAGRSGDMLQQIGTSCERCGARDIIRGCHNRDKGTAENERLRDPKFIFSYPKNERLIFLNGRNAAQEEISTMRVG